MIELHWISKKRNRQKLSTFMWPFNQSVASSALSVIIDFRQMLLAVVFNIYRYFMEYKCILFVLFVVVMFRCGNMNRTKRNETNLWNPWSEYSKHWLLVLLAFVSLSFMEWRFYSVYSFSISKSEYILFMNFPNTHTTIDSSTTTTLSIYDM